MVGNREMRNWRLIRAHPDLATQAKLTDDSNREQAEAGLDTLTAEEFARFTHLNELYKSKFDFPFIFAVKGATKQQILASFAERVNNSTEDEFAMALEQICRIFRFPHRRQGRGMTKRHSRADPELRQDALLK